MTTQRQDHPDPAARRPGEVATVGPPDRRLLKIYLGDHLAGADAATARSRWMAQRYAGAPFAAALAEVAEAIDSDRRRLRELARTAQIAPALTPRWLARAGERLGRLKPNGRVRQTSPLTPLVELEALLVGTTGKKALWAALRVWAEPLGLDHTELVALERDADRHAASVESMLRQVRSRAFATTSAG